jgi:hypothetical protein
LNTEILVRKAIAEAIQSDPGHLRVFDFYGVGNVFGGFSDDAELVQHGALKQIVFFEFCSERLAANSRIARAASRMSYSLC